MHTFVMYFAFVKKFGVRVGGISASPQGLKVVVELFYQLEHLKCGITLQQL